MKRRDFIARATSSAGLLLVNRAGAKPCPPTLEGGSGIPCPAGDAEADWQARISGPGVLAYHDFRSDDEVNRFRWAGGIGNDVSGAGDGSCRRSTTDGITGGGCLEIAVPAGGTANTGWLRPFSALTGGTNGRGIDDPGQNVRSWNVTDGRDYAGTWKHDFVSHLDYQGQAGYSFIGDEIYIQFRVKMTGGRDDPGQPPGKLAFIGITGGGTSHFTPSHELVLVSRRDKLLRAYTNFGSRFNSALTDPQRPSDSSGTIKQPGGAYDNTCIDNINCSKCWCYPVDEWVTVLVHIKAGRSGDSLDDINAQNTTLEISVARDGETQYTPVYSKSDFVIKFSTTQGVARGWNAFEPSAYMNGVSANGDSGWEHRYDQIIFSRSTIPCPQV